MKIVLFRHGETEENKKEIIQGQQLGTLTEEGMECARKLGLRFKDDVFTIIYSSDLDRAKRTAGEVIQYHPETPVEYSVLLRERDCGSLVGLPRTALDPENLPANYETDDMMKVRALEFIKHYLEPRQTSDDVVVISTHGAFSRVFSAALLNRPDINPDNVGGLSNTGVAEFEYSSEKGWEKTLGNCTKHLE